MSNTTKWYVGEITRCPTSFNTPTRIAIEATSPEHAQERLYKLYTEYYDRASVRFSVAVDTDDLFGARKHALPTKL